jgi:hypothetical protein
VIPSNERGDVGGCGDVNVECKNEAGWNNLAAHIEQTLGNAQDRGLPDSIVWRKRLGFPSPLSGYIVVDPEVYWAMRRRLEGLQAEAAEYERLLRKVADMAIVEVRGDPITEAVETNARILREGR